MKMKKMLAVLAAMTMMAAVTACGGTEGSSTAEPSSAPESSNSTAEESSDSTAEESSDSTAEESSDSTAEEAPAPAPQYVDETADLTIPEGAITFDTPSLYGFHAMGGGGDEADVELAIVDLDGDKKLRVRPLKADDAAEYGVPKIVAELPALIGVENTGNVGHISIDFTCVAREEWVNDDGSSSLVVGNFLGAIAGNIASEKGTDADGNLTQNTWATHLEFAFDDWENYAHSWRAETDVPALLPANGYAANDEGTSLVIMRWGQKNAVDFYLDNISILDKDGKPIEIIYDAEGNTVDVVSDSVESAGSTDGAAPAAADESSADESSADESSAEESSEGSVEESEG